MKLKLSSRQSVLAKTQAYQVGAALEKHHPNLSVEYLFRESLGDKNLKDPLWKMPEKGVFTEDFYLDLKEGRTDLVVHSWKDLPTAGKPDTEIAGTLPRADQRDLLLLKKSSQGKEKLRIFSSSPRRAFNLNEFLSWALPWKIDSLEFLSVRGNIPTRIQKLLEDAQTDGLVLAKAALDRLLVDERFPETIQSLRTSLELCKWMVLPLSENPNAAAQGALAVEISSSRNDIRKLVESINCPGTFQAASREREILGQYGGGCHLALGMSVLDRSYGRLEFVKGLSPEGEKIRIQKFIPLKPKPLSVTFEQLEFSSERKPNSISIEGVDALFVSKSDAWPVGKASESMLIWSAGLQTWNKLARQGVWVHGSSEGLGETEDPRLSVLAGENLRWGRVSHDASAESFDKKSFGTYHLELKLLSKELSASSGYRWRSASEFQTALRVFPELRNRLHLCGPGRTWEAIRKTLGSEDNIFIDFNWSD